MDVEAALKAKAEAAKADLRHHHDRRHHGTWPVVSVAIIYVDNEAASLNLLYSFASIHCSPVHNNVRPATGRTLATDCPWDYVKWS